MNNDRTGETEDPIDLLVKGVPRHLWVTIITVAIMLVMSWLFFKPPLPAAETAATDETLEGRVFEVLSEEQLLIAEQTRPVQRVVVEITRGSQRGQRVEVLHG